MAKEVYSYKQIREKLIAGLDKIAEPVINTLTPKGTNVIFEIGNGNYGVSNDGITIASQIELEDPVENATAQIARSAAFRTNQLAGDSTTTTILLTQALTKEGFKLIDSGWNPMKLKKETEKIKNIIIKELEKKAVKIKTDRQLFFVAKVSANDDEEIAENVVKAVKSAGENGIILLEQSDKESVEVEENIGFLINEGMLVPDFSNSKSGFISTHENVKILVTDKKIYTPEEAISVMDTLAQKGIRNVVVIASDFIGQAPNVFIENHRKKNMNILLVKSPDETSLYDLADYLDCKVFSEKSGQLLHKDLTEEHFGTADKVLSFVDKTLVFKEKSIARAERITAIKAELDSTNKEEEKKELEKRLSRMSSGTVTVRVGGHVKQETGEKMHRYEDAISATRISLKHGFVPGGGITLWDAFKASEGQLQAFEGDLVQGFKRVCQSPLKQIAKNCDIHLPTLMEHVERGEGYNASTEEYEDMLKAGIIEPVKAVQYALENAVSASGTILSSGFIITNIKENDKEESK